MWYDFPVWALVLAIPPLVGIIGLVVVTAVGMTTVWWTRHSRGRFAARMLDLWLHLGRSLVLYVTGPVGVLISMGALLLAAFRVGARCLGEGPPAMYLLLAWSLLEGVVFSFVLTPLVAQTLGGLTGTDVAPWSVTPVLVPMLFVFVLGSYAILVALSGAVGWRTIFGVLLVEFVSMVFEVVFLYREFVDALVPWFAQYTDYRPGLWTVLLVAGFVWAGIRGMTWFLFGSAGTPVVVARLRGDKPRLPIKDVLQTVRADTELWHKLGDGLMSALILPPLQPVVVTLSGVHLLLFGRLGWTLPVRNWREIPRVGVVPKERIIPKKPVNIKKPVNLKKPVKKKVGR